MVVLQPEQCWYDIAIYVNFNNAQLKLNLDEVQQQQDKQDGEAEIADTVNIS